MDKKIYLILACICNTLFRYRPFYFEFGKISENHSSYSVGQAMSYIFLLLYIDNKLFHKFPVTILSVVFWCAVSNLMDELFFDPLHLGWNEIAFAIGIIISSVIGHYYLKHKHDRLEKL